MTEACQPTRKAGRQAVEIDGIYVRVSDRIRPLASLLAAGCSEGDLRREVDAIKAGQTYDTRDLRELLDHLFLPHGLAIDEGAQSECDLWRLRTIQGQRGTSRLESALRCRMTLVPESAANRVAQSLTFLFMPVGFISVVSVCILIAIRYVLHFGLNSLSLDVLFKSLHQVSVPGIVLTIITIVFAALVHEVGHCTAVAACGSRVRRIGFGIYWFSPAFFSDV